MWFNDTPTIAPPPPPPPPYHPYPFPYVSTPSIMDLLTDTASLSLGPGVNSSISANLLWISNERPDPSRWDLMFAKMGLHDTRLSETAALYENIMKTPVDVSKYSDPCSLLVLPFAHISNSKPGDRFDLSAPDGSFQYIGRERFQNLYEIVISLSPRAQYQSLYLYGTIGYGKSYILASLVCALHRTTNILVLYLPDCRVLCKNPGSYMAMALLLTFASHPELQQMVIGCRENPQELARLCNELAKRGMTLLFVIDQLNAFDEEPPNQDDIANVTKVCVKLWLGELTSGHLTIKSASANHKSAQHMMQRQAHEVRMTMYGGYTKSEMTQWYKHHESTLPIDLDKNDIEDITGSVPLLLRGLPKIGSGLLYKDVRDAFLMSKDIRNVAQWVTQAAEKMHSQANQTDFTKYLQVMHGCLNGSSIGLAHDFLDHRYFYPSDLTGNGTGHYACGMARDTMVGFLHTHSATRFLDESWYTAAKLFRDNPSVLGFIVEQMCLTSITQNGMNLGETSLGKMSAKVFYGQTPTFHLPDFDSANERGAGKDIATLYIPQRFNFQAIDGVILAVNQAARRAKIIMLQVTLADRHTDSESAAMSHYIRWVDQLVGYTVTPVFVWITKNHRSKIERVPEKNKRLRKANIGTPGYDRISMTIADLNPTIAQWMNDGVSCAGVI